MARASFSARPGEIAATWRVSLGLATIMCGQPIGWGIRGQFFGGDSPVLPGLVVVIGFLLMVQPAWIVRGRLYAAPSAVAVPGLLMLLPLTALSLLAPPAILAPTASYAVLMVAVLLPLAMTGEARFDRLPEAVLIVGSASSAVPLAQLAIAGAAKTFFRLAINGNDNTLITGSIGGMTVIAGIVVGLGRFGGVRWGFGAAAGAVIGLVAMLLTNTRSALGMLVVCTLLFFGFIRKRLAVVAGAPAHQGSAFISIFVAGALLAPLAATAVLGPTLLKTVVQRSWDRLLGAFALVDTGGTTTVDVSTSIRTELLRQVWDGLRPAGTGYMAQAVASGDPNLYPHLSYAQAFYDLGFVGGAVYLIVALVIPLALIVRRLADGAMTRTAALVILLFVYSQGDQLAHGTPYSWPTQLTIVIVFAILGRRTAPVTPATFLLVA
jgi:hypothetical protein